MFGKNSVVVICRGITAAMVFLLCSCATLPPEPYSDYVGPVEKADLPEASAAAIAQTVDSNAAPAETGPLKIGIRQAILLAMENNQSLIVEKMNPDITRTFEQEELAVFDPVLQAQVTKERTIAERLTRHIATTESSTVDTIDGLVSVSKLFPTGTIVDLNASTAYTDSSLYTDTFTASRLGFTVTQALLEGLDVQANMARVNQARLDTLISQYELRGFTESLLAATEAKFWDYALANKQIEIFTNAMDLAQQQMNEIEERIKIGGLAETELAAAQAEVALRRENLINARSIAAMEKLTLLRLLNPSSDIDWEREVILEYDTTLPDIRLDDVEQHVEVAMKMRPDLNQARLQIQQGNLEVVRTKNGLLPRMDMFISYGSTGYADSFYRSIHRINGDSYDFAAGLVFEQPFSNRSARAQYGRAVLSAEQLRNALENLTQLAEVDVRTAYIEVNRSKEQIAATAATREAQEEKFRAETEKFRVGKSTALLVGQTQQDLVSSQIGEIRAIANYLKALINMYRLEGSLLNRRGILAPGNSVPDPNTK